MNQFYRQRVNAVMDYIEGHLDEALDLERLAQVACFSKYHFHRVFKSVTGETLNDYIRRQRLQKADRRLAARPGLAITELAYSLGFSSSANFSREFRSRYGEAPSRRRARRAALPRPASGDPGMPAFRGIQAIDEIRVIYSRVDTGYDTIAIRGAFQAIYDYSLGRGLIETASRSIGIGYDDPDYTPPDSCRYDACLELPPDRELEADCPFNRASIAGGRYAVFDFAGRAEDFASAWDRIFRGWAIESDMIPDDRPHLEFYLPSERYAEGIFETRLCLPILPAPASNSNP